MMQLNSTLRLGIFLLLLCSSSLIIQQSITITTYREKKQPFPFLPEGEENVIQRIARLVHNESQLVEVNYNTRFCLVHVGKTSGSKVRCELGTRATDKYIKHLKCEDEHPTMGNNALRKAYAGSIHMMSDFCKPPYQFFLYTTRNPLDRIVSWYNYERIAPLYTGKNKHWCLDRLHENCTSTVDEFARAAVPNHTEDKPRNPSCTKLAWDAATGFQACAAHNKMNYEHYLTFVTGVEREYERTLHTITGTDVNTTYEKEAKQKPVLVIRQEHLAEDWDGLQSMFDYSSDANNSHNEQKPGSVVFNTMSGTVSSRRGGAKNLLSRAGKQNLCAALCREIQMYKHLLLQARNINTNQAKQSILEVIDLCPEETSEIRICPNEKIPIKRFDVTHYSGVKKQQMLKFDIENHYEINS